MGIGYQLKRVCEDHGLQQTMSVVNEALATKKLDPYKVQIPDLARAFLGDVWDEAHRKLQAIKSGQVHVLESSEAVDASAFSNITGQLLVTIIKEKYNGPEWIGDMLMRTVPNPGGNLKEHKIPYLSDVIDKPETLSQAENYPHTKFAESWITMPAPEKRGEICAVTMEMLYSDLTGQAQDSAASIARACRYQKEERQLRVVLGITNPYKFNDVTMNTYLSTENATGKYINRLVSNTVTNYTHVNAIEQLFYKMRDPITERRIMSWPRAVLCNTNKRYDLKRVLNATETRSGDITSGTGDQVLAGNPLDVQYPVYTSPLVQALLADETSLTDAQEKEYSIWADFQKAFAYRQVYPMRTDVAPANNPMEFHQDIILAVKVSEFGVPFVYDPRCAVLSTSEAS